LKVHVGTANPVKVLAVEQAVRLYPATFPDARVSALAVDVEEFGHPRSLAETVEGAVQRARKCIRDAAFGFGLEGGLMAVPGAASGYMEVGACAIFDGSEAYLGLSPAYEWPEPVTRFVLEGKGDASQAMLAAGMTGHSKIGTVRGGAVGLLTGGRMGREAFTLHSIVMAMVRLDAREMYRR
jgi:inosine/xanthosine triphosphatase